MHDVCIVAILQSPNQQAEYFITRRPKEQCFDGGVSVTRSETVVRLRIGPLTLKIFLHPCLGMLG